ncbi:putative bifunctional diguanylate cyclase/phosphodiesterase [Alkalibacterium putridalgicola]|uniref:putative bifunctional diguanylate cyclase/phosphodiesterase n=1 Tax=Alkalibacterium putridalgicola TaxID=426703 RepID=UPI0034CFAE0B
MHYTYFSHIFTTLYTLIGTTLTSVCLFIFLLYLISEKVGQPSYIYSIIDPTNDFSNVSSDKTTNHLFKWGQSLKTNWKYLTEKKSSLIKRIKKSDEKIYELSYFDALTQLPNRMKLIEEFQVALVKSEISEKAIYHIDIDRFHSINELYGRKVGDKVLLGVVERLHTLLGQNALIFREGEDELYVFVDDTCHSHCRQTGRDIIDVIAEPFKINQLTFYVTASVGISHYPQTSNDIETLLLQAEIAMFKVKKAGKNNYHIFLPEDAVHTERKRRIEFGLKEALVNNELFLVYQPKVVLETGKIQDAEALLRWRHPDLGLVSPGEFIPIAEESGLINEIGYWVIYEAIRQTKEWHRQGIEISIAVNVSALQFEDRYLVRRIKNVLDLFELDAKYFIVEITESVMQNLEYAEAVIREMHTNNIRVAIDDFGTGYSSLSVLNNMFIDMVKIDKSFIDHVTKQDKTTALVKTMIQMGKSLDFEIVAEGIETAEQSDFLLENDCEYGQGYYYSKPLSSEDMISIVLETNHEGA